MSLQHTVRILPHDRAILAAEDQPLLQAAQLAGLNLPHSCRSGHCGSCRARLLAGKISYPNGVPPGLTAQDSAQGYVLLCQARAATDLAVEVQPVASRAAPEVKTLPCRLVRCNRLAADVMQIFLRLPAAEPLEFRAGQHVDILLEGNRRRSFCLASTPQDEGLIELHVRRVPGGAFSEQLFGGIRAGAMFRIEGPLGDFHYSEQARPALFLAGGTGFAPIKSMLRQALGRGGTRQLHLYWGARRAADLYEEALVCQWQQQHPRLQFHAVLSDPAPAAAPAAVTAPAAAAAPSTAPPARRHGLVHELVLADHPQLAAFSVYAAGPPAMMEAIRAGFALHGALPHELHFDSFDYAVDSSGTVA